MTEPTVQQLTSEVDRLTEDVRQMKNLLALFMVNGLADAFDGTGNQTFGGGRYRLDKNGLQILAGDTATPPGLFWLPSYLATIPYTGSFPVPAVNQWAGVVGDTQPGDNWVALEARRLSGTQPSYAEIEAYSDGGSAFSRMKTVHDNGAVGSLTVYGATASLSARASLGGVLELDQVASDPANVIDGDIWYRSDTDAVRVRANSRTFSLQAAGWGANQTIAAGVITISGACNFWAPDTQAAAATDDLDTINGGVEGQVIYLQPASDARTVVVKNRTGNLKLAKADFSLDEYYDILTLIFDGTNWNEVCRSDNGS